MTELGNKVVRRLKKLQDKSVQMSAQPVLQRLVREPPGKAGKANILGLEFEYVDGPSLSEMYSELFFDQFNDFWCEKPDPVILDCGANIGVSVLRYKHLYPEARITAFEPDPLICEVLRRNVQANDAGDVEVVEAAVWTEKGTVVFSMDHIESGRIEEDKNNPVQGNDEVIELQSVRLADYLDEPVDFIKLDIEGAELKVLQDCSDKLHNVDKMIIEVHATVDDPGFVGQIWLLLHEAGMKVMVDVWQPGPCIGLTRPYKRIAQTYDQWHCVYAWR